MKLDFAILLNPAAQALSLALLLVPARGLWAAGPAAPAPAAVQAPSAVQDPLEQLNAAFRQTYVQAKAASLAWSGPVLMVTGDQLLLYRHNAKAAEATIRPALYHRFKEVDHVPPVLHLMLSGPAPVPAGDLRAIRGLAQAARAGLKSWCPPPALARQERILDACLALMDEALRPAPVPPARLAAFAADLGPVLLADADDAAALELEALDRAVAGFRKDLGPEEWAAVRVVILGAHMPRDGEISLQYFTRLLGEPGEGGRIVYAESLWQPGDALDLLATHLVDGGMGAAFFGDPMRMHRDILADGARRWLDGHHLGVP